MPLNYDFDAEFERARGEVEQESQGRRSGGSGHSPSGENTGKWRDVFAMHPEGGGPFGGRNNALIRFVGFLRAKSFPHDPSIDFALAWNQKHCIPPLPQSEVLDLYSRAWAKWREGGHEDEEPDGASKKSRVLSTIDDLLDLPMQDENALWLVPKVLVRGGIHFLSAPSAGGKSWVLLDLSRCVATGEKWFGRFEIPQSAVLYVDEEMGERMTSRRVKQLGFPHGAPFYYLGKQGIKIHQKDDLAYICEVCKEREIALVILDTLTGVRPGLKENEVEHVSQLRTTFNAIVATGATLIVAHHDRKGRVEDDAPDHERMRGSGDLAAMADMAYGLSKRSGYYNLRVTKNRMLSEDEAANIAFELHEEGERVMVREIDPDDRSARILDDMSRRILEALRQAGEMGVNALAETVGGKKSIVSAAAEQLVAMQELSVRPGARGAKIYSVSIL